jgi:class 3 adenylate cyclase
MSDERRIVTILFADVVGSTALGEAMDPEDLRALLSNYYSLAREVIESHGGTVEKFIGDAVMAIFGLPRAHGDDAERALSATLELRTRLRAERPLAAIALRFGLATGEVVASRDQSGGDFLVTGDAVNLAARLQQIAELWEILCSERTVRATSRHFDFDPPRQIQLRGKAQEVRGFVLRSRRLAYLTPRLPMLGREADLEHLQLAARRSFGERRPQLVSIIAPAGAGKSRLLEEFLEHLPTTDEPPLVAVAQCLPYGQRLTFWPLRAVLHRFIGLTTEVPVDEFRLRVAAWLSSHGVAEPDWTAELLASTVGAAETAQPDRVAMFNAWRGAVQAAGRSGPVIIVFEDLHWSSDSLLDLAEHVMQPWAELPILMIALTRPELLDRRPAWGGGKRNYISISLEPLGAKATSEIVRQLLGEDSHELVRRIVERAEGNPFYAGELVRMMMEQAIDLTDNAAVEHALAHLPDTVHATVLARLDLLPADERWALQLGAVVGRSFEVAAIAALGMRSADSFSQTCKLLVARDLLLPSGDAYVFRHILIREVAYQTLPRAERARLHSATAAWLEERATGHEHELAELIAFHYREAVALSGATATEAMRRRTVDWLSRAADVAYFGAATIETSGHLRSAIELAEPNRLPELYERLGASMWSGTAADEPLRAALRLSEEQGRPPEDLLRILGRILMFATRFTGSVAERMSDVEMAALRARGRELLERVDPEGPAAARFLAADSFYPFWLVSRATSAEYSAAIRDSHRAAEIAERLGQDDLLSAALDGMAEAYSRSGGRVRKGLEISRRRIALGRRLSAGERLDAYSMVSLTCSHLGDLADADGAAAGGVVLAQPGQELAATLHLVTWRIYAMTLMGRWDAVVPLAHRARQLWDEMAGVTAGYALRGFIAATHVARSRGDSAAAATFAAVAQALLDEFKRDRSLRDGVFRRYVYLLDFDRAGLEEVAADWELLKGLPDSPERVISTLSDRHWLLSDSVTTPALAWAAREGFVPLEIQLRRAIGLREGDERELILAAESAEAIGARSVLMRVQFELARLRGDEKGMEAAIYDLEAMGDHGQISLYRG